MNKNKLKFFYCFMWLVLVLPLAACSQTPRSVAPLESSATIQSKEFMPSIRIENFDELENPVIYSYKKAPQRVVITHPGATELLLELGLEDRILSTVPPYGAPLARLSEKYTKLNIMKVQYAPSQEELLEMQPDLLIGWVHHFGSNEIGDVKTFHKRGIGTYIMPSTLSKRKPTLDNVVYASITDIGRMFGIEEKSNEYLKNYKKRVSLIEQSLSNVQHPKTVMVLQDHFNGTFSIYDDSYLISNMIAIARGKNICEDPASFVGAEKVLAFDPDFILFVSSNKDNPNIDLTDEEATNQLKGIKQLQSMRAIRENNIINLSFFSVNNGGIRTIDGIEKIARSLYPEAFN